MIPLRRRRPRSLCGLEPLEPRQLMTGMPEFITNGAPAEAPYPLTDYLVSEFVRSGNSLVFPDGGPTTGMELWKTDGTTAGTRLIKDANPGMASTILNVTQWKKLDAGEHRAYFVHESAELWVSDLTSGGTYPVPGGPSYVQTVAAFGDRAMFVDNDGQLWITDGEAVGTHPVQNVYGGGWYFSDQALAIGNGFFFVGGDGLARTDGTTEITQSLHSLSGYVPPRNFTNINGLLYFTATNGGGNGPYGLWRSDGTPEGTYMVKELLYGSSGASQLTNVNGTLMFVSQDATSGQELWRSDGTAAGTYPVADIAPGSADSQIRALAGAGNLLFFVANDGVHGAEAWRSDGTAAGTFMLRDLASDAADFGPQTVTAVDNYAYFSTSAGLLWRTDGTQDGTSPVVDSNGQEVVTSVKPPPPQYSNGMSGGWGALNHELIFTRPDGLWKTNGTAEGTVKLHHNPGGDVLGGVNNPLLATSSSLYFLGTDIQHGRELWKSDGTAPGTMIVKDMVPGPTGGAWSLAALPSRLYFRTFGSEGNAFAIWGSDGTESGTTYVADIPWADPQSSLRRATPIHVAGQSLYFGTMESTLSRLWWSDGTGTGTRVVADWPKGQFGNFVQYNGIVYFSFLDSATSNNQIWRTDGTAGNTVLVDTIEKGTAELTVFAESLFIGVRTNTTAKLWKSNGEPGGTTLVQDLTGTQLLDGRSKWKFTPLGSQLFFMQPGKGHDTLWVTDGTSGGAQELASGLYESLAFTGAGLVAGFRAIDWPR